ncbi:hypothetical protein MHBO_000857 [Bonamia ostreae]|uniref:Uncharacterized protein n=1 Tax=Bonamia ostreae TaxID=126728 RepID=A0ABV2AH38_9EUKA
MSIDALCNLKNNRFLEKCTFKCKDGLFENNSDTITLHCIENFEAPLCAVELQSDNATIAVELQSVDTEASSKCSMEFAKDGYNFCDIVSRECKNVCIENDIFTIYENCTVGVKGNYEFIDGTVRKDLVCQNIEDIDYFELQLKKYCFLTYSRLRDNSRRKQKPHSCI